jgi:hypothetical protein
MTSGWASATRYPSTGGYAHRGASARERLVTEGAGGETSRPALAFEAAAFRGPGATMSPRFPALTFNVHL